MGQMLSFDDYGKTLHGLVNTQLERLISRLPYLKLAISVGVDLPSKVSYSQQGGLFVERINFTVRCLSNGITITLPPKTHPDESLKAVVDKAIEILAEENDIRSSAAAALLNGESFENLRSNALYQKLATESKPEHQ